MDQSALNSFKAIFQDLYPGLVQTALFYLHDLPTAEDITQEIFTKLWEKQERLTDINNLKGYLSYAVKNRCLNYLEHQQVITKYQQEYLKQMAVEDQTEELIQKVQISLEKLPPKRRQILEMSIVESKTYQEIAELQGISINTVKDHIKKAYSFLRQTLHQEVRDFILYFALLSSRRES